MRLGCEHLLVRLLRGCALPVGRWIVRFLDWALSSERVAANVSRGGVDVALGRGPQLAVRSGQHANSCGAAMMLSSREVECLLKLYDLGEQGCPVPLLHVMTGTPILGEEQTIWFGLVLRGLVHGQGGYLFLTPLGEKRIGASRPLQLRVVGGVG